MLARMLQTIPVEMDGVSAGSLVDLSGNLTPLFGRRRTLLRLIRFYTDVQAVFMYLMVGCRCTDCIFVCGFESMRGSFYAASSKSSPAHLWL